MFAINIQLPDLSKAVDDAVRQVPFATAQAINATAREVQQALKDELPRVFDRPTPYIRDSIRVTRWATKSERVVTDSRGAVLARSGGLMAVIEPEYPGGKGVDPQKVLEAEVFGGKRRLKRAEVALQRVGILPKGYYTVPGPGAPKDSYGNVPGAFIVRLISYFQAFGEQGYRANMSDRRKRSIAKSRSVGGHRTATGVEYFVAYGKLRGGKTGHLHPGIWARETIHGYVQPVLLFVPTANYRPRYDFEGLARRVVDRRFGANFEAAFQQAMRTAR